MVTRRVLFILINVLLAQNICGQCLPLGGCGCQQIPVPQNLPVQNFQVANGCGCARNNLPNGIQFTNTFQIAKSLQGLPCGCAPNLQLGGLQNSIQLANIGSPYQLANGIQMANMPLSQNDLLALMNGVPIPNSQNVLQLSMQALLNQLGNTLSGGQCGCQPGLAQNAANSFLNNNLNLLGINGYSNAVNNLPLGLPSQPCPNVQMLNNLNGVPVTGTQEIVLNNAPCPCQSCQNPNSMSFTLYQ